MIKVVNATEVKNRFGELIKRAYLNEEHLIVKRGGIPVVAIVPMADYERLITPDQAPSDITKAVAISKKQELARRRLLTLLEEVHQKMPDVPEEEANRDIQEAIQAVRARK
jgi:prevent-host-death family protein